MELTSPLTSGFQRDTLYGGVAWKLKTLFLVRMTVLPDDAELMAEKVPTAYIIEPHCTSCRTCSTRPFGLGASRIYAVDGSGPGGGRAERGRGRWPARHRRREADRAQYGGASEQPGAA
jgi:hypothetical protein